MFKNIHELLRTCGDLYEFYGYILTTTNSYGLWPNKSVVVLWWFPSYMTRPFILFHSHCHPWVIKPHLFHGVLPWLCHPGFILYKTRVYCCLRNMYSCICAGCDMHAIPLPWRQKGQRLWTLKNIKTANGCHTCCVSIKCRHDAIVHSNVKQL